MTKSKQEFISQVHDKSFNAWWVKNKVNFPYIIEEYAREVFVAARIDMEKSYMKLRDSAQKSESRARKIQSKLDKQESGK